MLNTDSFKKFTRFVSTGTKVYGLSYTNFSNFMINLPTLEEQEKIGKLFKNLDKKLDLEEEKYEKLKAYKEAMLGLMFPKEGENLPELRFEGFEGNWETEQLKSLGNSYTSLSGKTKEDFGNGEGRYVTFSNVLANPIAKIDELGQIGIDIRQNEVKYGDVFFNISSETCNEVGLSSIWRYNGENVYLNIFCMGFRPNRVFDNYFLTYNLRSAIIRKQIETMAQGISRINISQKGLLEVWLLLPSLEEQEKIGQFFKNLDDKISLAEKRIEKIQAFKVSLMDKVFV